MGLHGDDTPLGFGGGPEEQDADLPPHRRTFSFSISPQRKGVHWGNSNSQQNVRNKTGVVPMGGPKVSTPRESSVEGWRQNITTTGVSRLATRPQSAPGRRRFGNVSRSGKVSTQELIQNSIARSGSNVKVNVSVSNAALTTTKKKGKRKKKRRPKSAALSGRRKNSTLSSSLQPKISSRMSQKNRAIPDLGIGVQFYTAK